MQQFPWLFRAPQLAPIEVEPAVGESFVVMFDKQVAPIRRENDSTVPCPARILADAGAWPAWQYVSLRAWLGWRGQSWPAPPKLPELRIAAPPSTLPPRAAVAWHDVELHENRRT